MKKLIIFDLDGTLLNSLKDLWAAVNGALWSVGLPYRTEEEVRQFVGDGVDMLIRRAIDDDKDKFAECKAAFRRIYDGDMKNQTRPYDGVQKMLCDLRAAGLKIAMGNAVPELKAKADYAAESERSEGVAEAVRKFVLI